MKEKTALEKFEELNKSIREFFLVVCHELKIDVMVKWLDKKIRAFRK